MDNIRNLIDQAQLHFKESKLNEAHVVLKPGEYQPELVELSGQNALREVGTMEYKLKAWLDSLSKDPDKNHKFMVEKKIKAAIVNLKAVKESIVNAQAMDKKYSK